MSSVNLATRELAIKIVYYGPGLGGKTTSLRYIHRALKPSQRGQLISLATGSDRTLYFDFLPVRLPKLGGFRVRAQLYTVPGQVHYNATRKLVLARADGVVFVADSHRERMIANIESMENLADNLAEQGRGLTEVPLVVQFNKRDIPDPIPAEELTRQLCPPNVPTFDTIATTGQGVFNALKTITTLVINDLRNSGKIEAADADDSATDSGDLPAAPALSSTESLASLAADSLSALGAEIEKLEPQPLAPQPSGPLTSPLAAKRVLSLATLVLEPRAASALARMEDAIERGDWIEAVQLADQHYAQYTEQLARAHSGLDAFTFAALLLNLPPQRLLRFRELTARIRAGGSASAVDATFALVFAVDVALRCQELGDGTNA